MQHLSLLRSTAMMLLLNIVTSSLQAQKNKNEERAGVENVAKLTFLTPGFSYEQKIGKFQTIQAYVFMEALLVSLQDQSSPDRSDTKFYFDPSFLLSYRYYHNNYRRKDAKRRTEKNSMDYIGPVAQVIFTKAPLTKNSLEQDKRRPVYAFGALYGLQRNYGSHFSLDLNFGPGVFVGKDAGFTIDYNSGVVSKKTVTTSQFNLLAHLTLGFWFGK